MRKLDVPIGAVFLADGAIEINTGRESIEIVVRNCGQRTIQVGSHFHFFEVNGDLSFPRELSLGRHLDIPSGTAVRFAPGEEKAVSLTEYAGEKVILGFAGLTQGCVDDPEVRQRALEGARAKDWVQEEIP